MYVSRELDEEQIQDLNEGTLLGDVGLPIGVLSAREVPGPPPPFPHQHGFSAGTSGDSWDGVVNLFSIDAVFL